MSVLQKLIGAPTASTYRNPADWFVTWLRDEPTSSGERVTHKNALSVSAYWAGVRLISEAIASLPLFVYRKRVGRGRDRITTHPVARLLHDEPNQEMTAFIFRETLSYHIINWGNAYAEIERRNDGMPLALWPLAPNCTKPIRGDDGLIRYEHRPLETGEARIIQPANILHIPGLSFDGLAGYSVLDVARESLGLSKAQDKYGSKFFANGAHLHGTLETDAPLGNEAYEQTKKAWSEGYEGLDNAHKTAILDNGLKYKAIGLPNRDAQWLESRKFQITEIARWLNIPPHKLRELTNATFSNIEHQNIEWVVDTLRPWLIRFEQEYRRKLFRDKSLYVEHQIDGLLRGDATARKEMYQAGRQWGWLSANDVRDLENLNPIDEGDIYLTPANMQDASRINEQPEPVAPVAPEETATEQAARGLVKNEAHRIRQALKSEDRHKMLRDFYLFEFAPSARRNLSLSSDQVAMYVDESLTAINAGVYPDKAWQAQRAEALKVYAMERSA